MGVNWDSTEWQAVWPVLLEDVRLIMEAADVPLCNTIKSKANPDAKGTPLVDVDEGICFNGISHDGLEPFILSRKPHHGWLKTNEKPYDTVVTCILLRAYLLAPDHVDIGSNGRWTLEWMRTRALYECLWPGEPIKCPWAENEWSSDSTSCTVRNQQSLPKNKDCDLKKPGDITIACAANPFSAPDFPRLSSGAHETGFNTVSEVDFRPLRDWLTKCDQTSTHDPCKASDFKVRHFPGVHFRVIDILQHCIVTPSKGSTFVALTYVWGGVHQPKLTTATESILTQTGGLDSIWPMLPTTVLDAIMVCEKLQQRYLWVDSLCIIQDSWRDMKIQIKWMRQIYSAAKCVIAAVSAETAEVGLLGSQPNGTLTLESAADLDAFIDSTPWSMRAWCYQEKVLAHRIILFTSKGLYMQCQKGSYDGTGRKLSDNRSHTSNRYDSCGGMLDIPRGEDLNSFASAVESYSQRNLTKPEDKMAAFQGILRLYEDGMDSQPSSFLHGLPICAFDQTFCWRAKSHAPHLRNKSFPSWSWLGWSDAVSFDRTILAKARTKQMIDSDSSSTADDWRAMLVQRRPASLMHGLFELNRKGFGFPAATHFNSSSSPKLHLAASITSMLISAEPHKSDGFGSCFAVFPIRCRQQPPLSPPKTITLWEAFQQHGPIPIFPDEETRAAPLVAAAKQTDQIDDFADHHSEHVSCEAQMPVGYIYLDPAWRAQQPQVCIMKFMALHGEKSCNQADEWTITMLMLLQRMERKGFFWGHERVTVMGCSLEQQQWLDAGATTERIDLI